VYAELVRKHGPERADLIGRVDRNLVIFPNLIILDLMGVVIRKITPTAAGHTRITQWSLASAAEDAVMRARRLENFITFQGPGGFATPDDLEALEACQAGFRAGAGVPWSDLSRGMHREHGGRPCRSDDELHLRAFWRQWQEQRFRTSSFCRCRSLTSPTRSPPGIPCRRTSSALSPPSCASEAGAACG
jgi:hypothetical protein